MSRSGRRPTTPLSKAIEAALTNAGCQLFTLNRPDLPRWLVIRNHELYLLDCGAIKRSRFWENFKGNGGIAWSLEQAKQLVGLV